MDFVLCSVDKEAVVFTAVGVEGMSQGHHLDGLTLLQDAARGAELV